MTRTNAFGQPVGPEVPDWSPRRRPPDTPLEGRACRVVRLDPAAHGTDLRDALARADAGANWTYLGVGPFGTDEAFDGWLADAARGDDPLFHAIVDRAAGRAAGVASLMRIDPGNGVVEVGNIHLSTSLQRTVAATEAMYLLMRRVFDELGYRRYEWKCDALNAPSRRAAERLGFRFEGVFRRAVVYKGRSRDTAWFSVVDAEWPAVRDAFEAWLEPGNFDAGGRQRRPLREWMSMRGAERPPGA